MAEKKITSSLSTDAKAKSTITISDKGGAEKVKAAKSFNKYYYRKSSSKERQA